MRTVPSPRACHDKNPQQARGGFNQNVEQKTGPRDSSSPTPNAGGGHKAPHAKHCHSRVLGWSLQGCVRKRAERSCVKKIPSAELPHPKSTLPLGPPSSIFRKKS